MVIDDHINLTGSNPLIGANDDRFGPRFPDMSEVYSRRLRGDRRPGGGRHVGVAVAHGVYVAVHGPSYETPAEIRAFRTMGADAVGMSTVPEAIAARHAGLEVLGISCITNMAAGVLPQPLVARRGDGDGAPRARLVHRAAGGRDCQSLSWCVAAARRARKHARADYSKFRVGAALETADGTIVTGCNIENATYGLTDLRRARGDVQGAVGRPPALPPRGRGGRHAAIRRRRAARAGRSCGSSGGSRGRAREPAARDRPPAAEGSAAAAVRPALAC